MYFIIIFLSPVYLAKRQKWSAFTVNLILYLLAWLTIWFGIGAIFWAFGVAHAAWHYRKEDQLNQAKMIAAEMVKAKVFDK